MNKDFYTIQEFADLLQVHHMTVRNMIKKGKLNYLKFNQNPKGHYRIPRTEIDRLGYKDFKAFIENYTA